MALPLWFFGSGAIAVPALQAVAGAHEVLGVVTQPDRPQGRGQRIVPTPVHQAAQALGLTVATPASPRDPGLADRLRASRPDLIVVMAYGGILPKTVLEIPRHGAVNVHPSLLPTYRGAAPIPWAILNGDHETGITLFVMDAQVDHGPILVQERTAVHPDDTTASLTERLSQLAPAVLLKGLAALEARQVSPTPQDDHRVTLAPRLTKADGWVDWALPAETIARRVRALNPWPGTMTSWQGHAVKLLQAAVEDRATTATPGRPPGTVLQAEPAGILVQTSQGTLRLLQLQLASGRPLEAAAFLRGHPIRPDEQLGSRENA